MIDSAVLASISPPPAAEPEFRLLRRDAVLKHLPDSAPLIPVIRGDVARVRGHGLVARWDGHEPDGTTTFAWAVLPADADIDHRIRGGRHAMPAVEATGGPRIGSSYVKGSPDIDLTAGAVYVNPHRTIGEALERSPGPWPVVTLIDPWDRELARLKTDFPLIGEAIATALELRSAAPIRLFDPGPVRRQPTLPGALDIDWGMLLAFHLEGQHGLYGSHTDEPLTAAQTWALGLEPVDVENRHAIRTGRGRVRSRFALDDDQQRLVPPWHGRPRRAFVEVLTALGGGAPTRTIATIDLEIAAG